MVTIEVTRIPINNSYHSYSYKPYHEALEEYLSNTCDNNQMHRAN